MSDATTTTAQNTNVTAQATRVIHFSQLYGSMQVYLECNCGDIYQNYMDGYVGCYPDYSQAQTSSNEKARIKPILVQSDTLNEIKNATWAINNTALEFWSTPDTDDATLYPCSTAGYTQIFGLRKTADGEYLEIRDNFAQALLGQSAMLHCFVTIRNSTSGVNVMTVKASIPMILRQISGNEYSIHIVPGDQKELGIQANQNIKQLFCDPKVSISKGVAPVTSLTNMKVVWEYFTDGAWQPVPTQVYDKTNANPLDVTTPQMKAANDDLSIIVPCGAVNSQLLIRAKLYNTATPTVNSVPVATDTATIYDNSDLIYISPNPNREEMFQIGNSLMEAPIVYTPAVMKGETPITSNYTFKFTLFGSAGEKMPVGYEGVYDASKGTYTIRKEDAIQANCTMTLTIEATLKAAA